MWASRHAAPLVAQWVSALLVAQHPVLRDRPRYDGPNSALPIPQWSYGSAPSRHVVVLCFQSSCSNVFVHAASYHTAGYDGWPACTDPCLPPRRAPDSGEAHKRTMNMPSVRGIALALALALIMTLPAFAQRPQAAPTVTKTWTLTLYGDVPPGESFGVEYRDPAGRDVAPLYFCGPTAASTCSSDGTSYVHTLVVPQGFALYFRIFRGQPYSPAFESIQDGWETMTADSTTAVQYRMPADGGTAAPSRPQRVYVPIIAP